METKIQPSREEIQKLADKLYEEHNAKIDKGGLVSIPAAWRCNVPGLFEEIINAGGNGSWIFTQPLRILYGILQSFARDMIESDANPEIIGYLARLSLLSIAQPGNEDFNEDATNDVILRGAMYKKARKQLTEELNQTKQS